MPANISLNSILQPSLNICFRLHDAVGKLLLQLLSCKSNCQALLAGEQAVALVQRLAAVLDTYIEEADQSLGKQCQILETLLQVRSDITALSNVARPDFSNACMMQVNVQLRNFEGIATSVQPILPMPHIQLQN